MNPLALTGLGRAPDSRPSAAGVEANVRHLIMDTLWYGFLVGSTINFLQVYVVRLGGISLWVSAVTYGPALVNIFWQMPAARLMGRMGVRMRWVIGAGLAHRLCYLAIVAIPLLTQELRAEWTVLVLVLQAIPLTLASTSFLAMLADAVPPDRITQVVSWRTASLGLTTTVGTLAAGQILSRIPFPLNYQILFSLGFVSAMISQWHLTKLQVPDPEPLRSGANRTRDLFKAALRFPGFAPFVAIVGILQLAIGMATPLLPLFWIRGLGATDAQISIVVTVYSAASVLGALLLRQIGRRFDSRWILALAAAGYASYPLLTALSQLIWIVLPWAALGGAFNAIVTVIIFDNLVSVTPEQNRGGFIAIYNLAVNVALFAGPLVAGILAVGSDGRTGLMVTTLTALIAATLFGLRLISPRNPPKS